MFYDVNFGRYRKHNNHHKFITIKTIGSTHIKLLTNHKCFTTMETFSVSSWLLSPGPVLAWFPIEAPAVVRRLAISTWRGFPGSSLVVMRHQACSSLVVMRHLAAFSLTCCVKLVIQTYFRAGGELHGVKRDRINASHSIIIIIIKKIPHTGDKESLDWCE